MSNRTETKSWKRELFVLVYPMHKKRLKNACHPKKIPSVVYSVIQLENNLLKALLAFEKGIGGKKKEICIDSLLVETGNLKMDWVQ